MKELAMDNRSMMSKGRKSNKGSKKQTISVYKELDDNIFEGMKMPIEREGGGNWLMDADFNILFHYIQVYHDPKQYEFFDTFEVQQDEC